MSTSLQCACGAVTVSVVDDSPCAFSAICHCTDCRATTGAPFFWGNAWLMDKIKVTGETITHQELQNVRHSCAQCGSFTHEPCPGLGMTMLPAARLENPTAPMMHVFTRSSVYMLPEDGLPRFEELPPMG